MTNPEPANYLTSGVHVRADGELTARRPKQLHGFDPLSLQRAVRRPNRWSRRYEERGRGRRSA